MRRRFYGVLVGVAVLLGGGVAVWAQDKPEVAPAAPADASAPVPVMLHNVRAFATADRTRPTAIFVDIHNMAPAAVRLVSAASPLCGRTELHTHLNEAGVMQMRRVAAIDVPAQDYAHLRPMGDHIMCFDVTRDLTVGESFALTLTFENGATVQTAAGKIVPMGEAAGGDHVAPH